MPADGPEKKAGGAASPLEWLVMRLEYAMSFDMETSARLVRGTDEALRRFAIDAAGNYAELKSMTALVADLRNELAARDSEIEVIKADLLETEEIIDLARKLFKAEQEKDQREWTAVIERLYEIGAERKGA